MNKKITTISPPPDMDKSVWDLFEEQLQKTHSAPYFKKASDLLHLSEQSLTALSYIDEMNRIFESIPTEEFHHFIHILHLTLFIQTLKTQPLSSFETQDTIAPITTAIQLIIAKTTISTALTLLPTVFIDVLTAHPVDMDRGLIVNHKEKLAFLTRKWILKKEAYTHITQPALQYEARAELKTLHQSLNDTLILLINTPNYRKTKIKPESEQRNLSRAIKANEKKIVTHWNTLISFIQLTFLEAIVQDNLNQTPDHEALIQFKHLPRTPENIAIFSASSIVQSHPCFSDIMNIPHRMTYHLHVWRGDMDGNPFVTGQSISLSIAYGRKRCFERISADDAVIRYTLETPQFITLQNIMNTVLQRLKQTGRKVWKQYILHREYEGWNPVQIYSGLTYYRMVELTEAAEKYSRHPQQLALLKVGFKDEQTFLNWTQPLEDIEKEAGITQGVWTQYRALVQLRGLSLGMPHARKGEKFHNQLVEEIISHYYPQLSYNSTRSISEKVDCLTHLLTLKRPPFTQLESTLSEESCVLLSHYLTLIKIQPDFMLIQSDSGSVTHNIRLSILILKAISHILQHKGKLVILCEDEDSMNDAIKTMNEAPKSLFKNVIMMCAGSDNQKKSGPFYSGYINYMFLMTAYHHHIPSFFGVGDSPLRSSEHYPICMLKTFQPGSRKQVFVENKLYPYLAHRISSQINTIAFETSLSKTQKSQYVFIAKLLGESMISTYKTKIQHREALELAIQSISEIVTTYFSRPSKKYSQTGPLLEQIRAIDSSRAQLILNTFDPQLAGLQEGLSLFLKKLKESNISTQTRHDFFNHTPLGTAYLNTIKYYIQQLDDDLAVPHELRHISSKMMSECYKVLSGKHITSTPNPHLRLSRILWTHINNTPEKHQHKAIAMMPFGANWMI